MEISDAMIDAALPWLYGFGHMSGKYRRAAVKDALHAAFKVKWSEPDTFRRTTLQSGNDSSPKEEVTSAERWAQIATIVKDLIETLMLWNGQASAGLDVNRLAGLRDELNSLARAAAPQAGLSDDRIDAIVLTATKHLSDPAIRLQTDKEIRAIIAEQAAAKEPK